MDNIPTQPSAHASPTTTLVHSEAHVAYRDLPMGALADEITRISVDGRPAHPEIGPRRIRRLMVSLVGAILILGVLVALIVGRPIGLGMAAFGVLFLIANPELWATVFRAKERRRAQRRVERTNPALTHRDSLPSRSDEMTPPRCDWGNLRDAPRRAGDHDDGVIVGKGTSP